jgi:hypothetical protein
VTVPAAQPRDESVAAPSQGARPATPRRHSVLPRLVRLACIGLLLAPTLVASRPLAITDEVRAAAQPYDFNLVAWEAARLRRQLPTLLRQLGEPPAADAPVVDGADAAIVQEFFAAVGEWREARAAGAPADDAAPLRARWEAQREAAGAAIERAVSALASQQGLTAVSPFGTLMLPPTSIEVTEPPRVLVVSPREHVEVAQSILLRSDVTTPTAEALERDVDSLGMSGLVVTIGGIATYPAIVPLQSTPLETLSAVAHEWLHGYLFFRPLGRAYLTSYDARSLNETVADLGGRELGRLLAVAFELPTQPAAARQSADGAAFNFRQEMQATRVQLDALLAAGQVDEAEAYLDQRRQDFVAAGYPIRKLNQAYFAFNGSYGDSPASVSPLNRQVRALRAESPDLGSFLRRVANMSSSSEVAAAVGEAAPVS